MKKAMLAPSMMCADFLHLEEQLRLFENEGIDLLHVDIMDGHFVPNMSFGYAWVKSMTDLGRACGIEVGAAAAAVVD